MRNTNKLQKLPSPFEGISVIYFHDKIRNRHVELSADKELAKLLARFLYRDVKLTISKNQQKEQTK